MAAKPVVRKIAVIPPAEPLMLTLKNDNGVGFISPITTVAFSTASKEKARVFNQKLPVENLALGKVLMAPVVEALLGAGYQVEVLEDLYRPADDPDNVDYETVKTDAEMVIQLRFDEVGVHSTTFSLDYLPRVNVKGRLYVKSLDDSIYDETLYFGVDAKKGKAFTIVSDPRFAYPSFDILLARTDEVGKVFQDGTDSLARMMASQLVDTLASKARRAP